MKAEHVVAAALAFALGAVAWVMVRRFCVLRAPSITGVAFLTLFAMHGVSAVPYWLGWFPRGELAGHSVNQAFPGVVALSFMFLAAGALLGARTLRLRFAAAQEMYLRTAPSRGPIRKGVLAAVLALSIIVSVLYLASAGGTVADVVREAQGDAAALRDYRAEFASANPYAYVGAVAKRFLLPFLVLLCMNAARVRRDVLWRVLGVALFGLLLVAATADLHKAPVVLAVLFLLANWYYSRAERRASLLGPGALALAAVLALGSAGYVLTYHVDAGTALRWTLYRVAVAPQFSLEAFLTVYPEWVPHNHGAGVGIVAAVLGLEEYVSPPLLVGRLVTGSSRVSLNAYWASEMWAAFGYTGVIVSSAVVGFLLVLGDWLCLRARKTEVAIALYGFLTVGVMGIASASVWTLLLSGGLGLAPVLAWALGGRMRAMRSEPGVTARTALRG